MGRRSTAEETVGRIARILRDDPSATRRQVADRLGLAYGYVCQRWKAACEEAGVGDERVSQRGSRKGGADLLGRRFGHLAVLADLGTDGHGGRHWLCRCDCGREAVRGTHALTSGSSTQCARWDHDLLGRRFGRLTVMDFAGFAPRGGARFRCRCDCGRETTPLGSDLKRGAVLSCGCARDGDFVDGTKLSGLDAALSARSTSGVTGVRPSRGRWAASITLSGHVYYLGEYRSFERAIAVRREAEEVLFDPMLERHGLEPTDEEAWREQVEAALEAIRERHRP